MSHLSTPPPPEIAITTDLKSACSALMQSDKSGAIWYRDPSKWDDVTEYLNACRVHASDNRWRTVDSERQVITTEADINRLRGNLSRTGQYFGLKELECFANARQKLLSDLTFINVLAQQLAPKAYASNPTYLVGSEVPRFHFHAQSLHLLVNYTEGGCRIAGEQSLEISPDGKAKLRPDEKSFVVPPFSVLFMKGNKNFDCSSESFHSASNFGLFHASPPAAPLPGTVTNRFSLVVRMKEVQFLTLPNETLMSSMFAEAMSECITASAAERIKASLWMANCL
ncbi:MAG: DUF1826 domain-containing protein [Bdellovibrionales bacterium]|nr:DUF1826 domain-containing protein [Bdellovibrionales bacterium]